MANTHRLIASVTLGASTASLDFTSIPQTYTDLKLVVSGRIDGSTTTGTISTVRFNGSTTDRTNRRIYTTGGSIISNTGSFIEASAANDGAQLANTFGYSELYIPNYTSTTVAKSAFSKGGSENNLTTVVQGFVGSLWNPATQAAITSITVHPTGGFNFVANSTAYLYGISKTP